MVEDNLKRIYEELPPGVKLVAVSKFHPSYVILSAYQAGQRCFGENRPQEFCAKARELPADIEWHFIGHLQTNKLKLVLPYASLVESVDSLHLLDSIENWGKMNDRVISVLLELHLGAEETKGGFTEEEITRILESVSGTDGDADAEAEAGAGAGIGSGTGVGAGAGAGAGAGNPFPHIRFCGLMGMATNTDDDSRVEADFIRIREFKKRLDSLFPNLKDFRELSIGMSNDWKIAVRQGATIVRIGTAIFGPR
ncbi:MAG: YggS family pyridoxal phosphate enzyme [Bacteroidales bacterium]|nr:YggS family pyridoxal phosphate enzyme [Bacteroidales bacterium]